MVSACKHPAGYIPGGEVSFEDWNDKLAAFVAKVVDFNVRGQRDQIEHPGFIQEFKFCPHCGEPIDRVAQGFLTYGQAFEQHDAANEADKKSKLPHMKKPCRDCPFTKASLKGWLGEQRITSHLAADTFVCHKKQDMQCAGHMLINGFDNAFVRIAARMRIPLDLSGAELVFESKAACIEHHKN